MKMLYQPTPGPCVLVRAPVFSVQGTSLAGYPLSLEVAGVYLEESDAREALVERENSSRSPPRTWKVVPSESWVLLMDRGEKSGAFEVRFHETVIDRRSIWLADKARAKLSPSELAALLAEHDAERAAKENA